MFDVLAFFGVIPAPRIEVASISRASAFVTLRWASIPGRRYRLQFKAALDDVNWAEVSGTVFATGNLAFASDPQAPGVQRFYRVVMVD